MYNTSVVNGGTSVGRKNIISEARYSFFVVCGRTNEAVPSRFSLGPFISCKPRNLITCQFSPMGPSQAFINTSRIADMIQISFENLDFPQ
jgi:hypothetical protein